MTNTLRDRADEAALPLLKRFGIRGRIVFMTFIVAMLAGGIGGWAATAELAGAVIAPGSVVVEKNVKKVQHSDGGIVAEIKVKNGDRVSAGDVLIRLDDTQIKAELSVVRGQLLELTGRHARLTAEATERDKISFSKAFLNMGPKAREIASAERRLFKAGISNVGSQKKQLKLQIGQLRDEINGLNAQLKAKGSQLRLIRKELGQIRRLFSKKLTTAGRVYALEREEERLRGEHGGLQAQLARTRGKINETEVQILNADQAAKLDARRELRSTEAKINELREREVAAADRLTRTTLYAPQGGVIHELGVHTIGGVVTAAETIMTVVPADEKLTVEARVAPVDVDQVHVGRATRLRFSAFNHRTTPEFGGRIVQVSADVSTDPKTGQQYYVSRIEVDEDAKKTLADFELIPGMPVEVFVPTGQRTALSYLIKPIEDQFARTFREE